MTTRADGAISGPERLAGVCMERGLEMVVAMLGILKAGGAYVPLDPGYPKERLKFMVEDTQAPVVVTQSGLLDSTRPAWAPHAPAVSAKPLPVITLSCACKP